MIRGEIWWADLGVPLGSEPGFNRPVLIVQDDAFNKSRINTVIIIPLTTNMVLADAPGNVMLELEETKLAKDSVAIVSQIGVIDRTRLREKVSKLNKENIEQIEYGIKVVLGIK
jgi:mRNA interferase MazF